MPIIWKIKINIIQFPLIERPLSNIKEQWQYIIYILLVLWCGYIIIIIKDIAGNDPITNKTIDGVSPLAPFWLVDSIKFWISSVGSGVVATVVVPAVTENNLIWTIGPCR